MSLIEVEEELRKMHSAKVMVSSQVFFFGFKAGFRELQTSYAPPTINPCENGDPL